MTWGKIASWGVAAAMTAAPGLAAPPAPAVASAQAGAEPLAGYTPISTGQGMCLDATDGLGRDGQPVQLNHCLGDREQAWQAEPDGTSVLWETEDLVDAERRRASWGRFGTHRIDARRFAA